MGKEILFSLKKEGVFLANKRTRKPVKKKANGLSSIAYEAIGLVLIGVAIIIFFEFGIVGRTIVTLAKFLFGNLDFLIPFFLVLIALMMMFKKKVISVKNRVVIGAFLIACSLTIFSHGTFIEELMKSKSLLSDSVIRETWRMLITEEGVKLRSDSLGGGMIGALLFSMFHVLFDSSGTKVVASILFIIGVLLIVGKAFIPILSNLFSNIKKKMKTKKKRKKPVVKTTTRRNSRSNREREEEVQEEIATTEIITNNEPENEMEEEPIISAFTENLNEQHRVNEIVEENNEVEEIEQFQNTIEQVAEQEDYQLPSMNLLSLPLQHDQSGEYSIIQANAKKLEQTFQSFGVKAKVSQVHLGPAVTKYEVMPDVGVKVSKIVSLQDDLALALAAKDIRIEAPIPGKSAIGIEVPNSEVAVVTLREVLESRENNKPDSKLLIGFGRDIAGKAILAELDKMPHLLVAGSTGSGKSVCINGIIISILMRAKPHEVKMMLIDPKMVELNVYNGIPHLLAPVVTDARKAAQALQKVVSEMERRYDLFSHTGTRNIKSYNEHIDQFNKENGENHPKLPYIVVIIDELADLMMVASHDVEDAITRLAQMARASGIHLIIATQRPSVDVITGVIKANIPSRIAFAVSSSTDSRTILDMGGAERLLGRGDMLFLPAGSSKPTRVQGAFVSDEEVEKVVTFVIEQQKAQYDETMIPTDEVENQIDEETDELYDEAVQLVVEMQSASVSMLQRRFRIGYSRAARIMDQMEMRGVVGPPDGSRPRQVLINKGEHN